MKLKELFEKVKDENLTKEQLEDFYSQMSRLRADVKMELSGLQKEKALFMLQEPEKSVAERKVAWAGSEKGQREIELKSYISAIGDHLNSLKTRIYSLL
jgi:cytochrome c2